MTGVLEVVLMKDTTQLKGKTQDQIREHRRLVRDRMTLALDIAEELMTKISDYPISDIFMEGEQVVLEVDRAFIEPSFTSRNLTMSDEDETYIIREFAGDIRALSTCSMWDMAHTIHHVLERQAGLRVN